MTNSEFPWLLPQERRLWCGAALYSLLLDLEPASDSPADESQRRLLKTSPSLSSSLQETIKAFISALPLSSRDFWLHYMTDRSKLIDCFAEFPRSLIHGDLVPDNIGLCQGRKKLVMIDWEWFGEGTPAFDAHHFLSGHTGQFFDFASNAESRQEPLRNYFLDRFVEYGGTGYSAELWEKAWDAVLVWDSLTFFPIVAGNAIKKGTSNRKLIDSKIETLTSTAMQVLQ